MPEITRIPFTTPLGGIFEEVYGQVDSLAGRLKDIRAKEGYPKWMPWIPGTNIYVDEIHGQVHNGRQSRICTIGITLFDHVDLLRIAGIHALDRSDAAEDIRLSVEGFRGQEEYPDFLLRNMYDEHKFLAFLGREGAILGRVVHEPIGEVVEGFGRKFSGLETVRKNRVRCVRGGIFSIINDIERVLDGEHQVDVFSDRLHNGVKLAELG